MSFSYFNIDIVVVVVAIVVAFVVAVAVVAVVVVVVVVVIMGISTLLKTYVFLVSGAKDYNNKKLLAPKSDWPGFESRRVGNYKEWASCFALGGHLQRG